MMGRFLILESRHEELMEMMEGMEVGSRLAGPVEREE